ncbi:MAG: hypothetical protein JKY48_07385, partial [Flavobacteriales bacterium]|nr:hypothetical protein [Flavobacteriales bacterium]
WQQSDHSKAMAVATADNVLGDFSGNSVNFQGTKSRVYREKERFLIDTAAKDGVTSTFAIKYTFGFYPLQQYLVELENGHIQALNIAWDSRSNEEGGQRWFHLQPDENITLEHPFFWTRHFQNWNSRCADCHSTNITKNYSADLDSYNTTWSDINVACEACHGAGSEHVAMATKNNFTDGNGFRFNLERTPGWSFTADDAIAKPKGLKNSDHINMCGNCHSRRSQLVENSIGQDFHNTAASQLLNRESYFPDGQIRDEVFVLGSFLQSKMHAAGVTCSNCHNAHTGKIRIEGNGLCSQCHRAEVYDSPKHHHHAKNTEGAACVNCHMPARTYMQIDPRRDHKFGVPRPDLSLALGVPNACTDCHQQGKGLGKNQNNKDSKEKDNAWALESLTKWGIKFDDKHWSYLNHRIQQGDILATRPLSETILKGNLPHVISAGLLQQLETMPPRVSAETAVKSLEHTNPVVRKAAVRALRAMSPPMRWQLLSPHMDDSSLSVRVAIGDALADIYSELAGKQQAQLASLIEEYRKALVVSAGSPATQVALANLEARLGNDKAAEKALLQALRIEPSYVPAMLNLADYYRASGRDAEVEPLLKTALKVAPDSGAAHHSYGLFLVRMQNFEAALPQLETAIQQADALPRYAYVYAVALESIGQTPKAVDILIKATERWPNQYDLLMLLVDYLD